MDIANYIISQKKGLFLLLGPAGSGKTTLSKKIEKFGIKILNTDNYFIGNSEYRKKLLKFKSMKSVDEYIDACNQISWWDWDSLDHSIEIEKLSNNLVLVEGAIGGPDPLLDKYDRIFFLSTNECNRFINLIKRDLEKRGPDELCRRFLITEYSENLHYRCLLKLFPHHKFICIDSEGNFINSTPLKYISNGNRYEILLFN